MTRYTLIYQCPNCGFVYNIKAKDATPQLTIPPRIKISGQAYAIEKIGYIFPPHYSKGYKSHRVGERYTIPIYYVVRVK